MMTVTLKKASVYAQALIEAASKTAPPSTRAISVFTSEKPSDLVERATVDMLARIDESLGLLEAGYALRLVIGEVNATNGVDRMLTAVALLDKKISTLQSLKDSGGYGAIEDLDDALDARIAQMREDMRKSDKGFGRSTDSLSVSLVADGSDTEGMITDRIASYKLERDRLKDEITAINFATRIELPTEVESALRSQKLIN